MAITKIHPIKATLNLSIEYICNPEKTDEKLLISSYACSPEFASFEFANTRSQGTGRGDVLAHHLIQAFAPDETTPEQAHKIGKKLAEKLLNGKHEYVISTHIDKGHIHNHIIFNAVDMDKHRTFEYEQNRGGNVYWKIRKISDELCEEHGLSVIKNAEKSKGKGYYEWQQDNKGNSWKTKLKNVIDDCVRNSENFDDFLKKMNENGYEIKRGKFISFRAKGQERFTRSKTLCWYYEEEQIKTRIERALQRKSMPKYQRDAMQSNAMRNVIDVDNNEIAQQNAGFAHWAMLNNMKEVSKALNYLTSQDVSTLSELEEKIHQAYEGQLSVSDKIKDIESEMSSLTIRIKNIKTYRENKPIHDEYEKAIFKDKFFRKHESEIMLYSASKKALKQSEKGNKLPSVKTLEAELEKLKNEKSDLLQSYKQSKIDIRQLELVKKNMDVYLSQGKEKTVQEVQK